LARWYQPPGGRAFEQRLLATVARAVDLSENLAVKKSPQATGRNLGLRLLEHFVNTQPAQR
jgi:hypothetical protein